ncbi:hypothetical protein [Mycobacterium simiae]|uniref:hypothetical protein n=1 Tax=Mycobacterium simiae TaxID=1784 RepID=UPI00165F8228|nr:hypothetical protein [Mycobacterium simiae]
MGSAPPPWDHRPLGAASLPRSAPSCDAEEGPDPNEAYAALAGVAPTTHVALGRDDHIWLSPVAWRGIQP